jgi:ABC-type transporter Mla subunit MlaD
MSSVAELACSLSSELDTAAPCANAVAQTLDQLCEALEQAPGAAAELDEILFDLHGALIKAAGTSAAAEGRVRRLLSAAVQHCAAREVFTLCLATLSQNLRWVLHRLSSEHSTSA